MGALWSSYGVGQYAPAEAHLCVTPRLWKADGSRRGCVLHHGRGGGAVEGLGYASAIFADRGYPALTPDCGGPTHWGNDTSIARAGDAADYLASRFGAAADKVVLCGISMGALSALNWAHANPDRVAAVALITPVVNVADIHDNNLNGWQSEIRAAYGGQAGYEAAVVTHNPILVAEDFTGVPMRLFYSTNDPTARPTPVLAFAEASDTEAVPIGATGHALGSWDAGDAAEFLRDYVI